MKKHLMINISALISAFALFSITTVWVTSNSDGVGLSYAINETIVEETTTPVIINNESNTQTIDINIDKTYYQTPTEDLNVISLRNYNNLEDLTIPSDVLLQMEINSSNYNKKTYSVSASELIRVIEEKQEAEKEVEILEEIEEQEEEVKIEIAEVVEEVTPVVEISLPEGYQEKFAKWYQANTDVQGWLKLDGTKLNYPVMQTTNDYYYLNRNLYKESDVWGIPYMSSFCTTDVSTNTILFGHSRDATGEQLSTLKNYRNIEFYKSNPVIEFDSVYADGDYKIIAYFIENTDEASTFFRYHEFINQTNADYINNFIEQAKLRSYINTTVDYLPTDKFLTISTCEDSNTSNFNRLVLVARKVREDETIYVDTTGATQNSNQLLPR